MQELPHAMGDVHPHPAKAKLAQELSRITFERWTAPRHATSGQARHHSDRVEVRANHQTFHTAKTVFCNSGFEAVETALKTAMLATGRRDVVAFTGGYHGLGYGALNATHREHFRSPFRKQLGKFGHFVEFPTNTAQLEQTETAIRRVFRKRKFGAILVEPIQVRGGIRIPPPRFLRMLRRLCDELGSLLVLDEIYTGFGRTGKWFACEHQRVVPDLICLGKALTGGFPLSACVGSAVVMDAAWPRSSGEAIHTSTFLGNPVGCAMAMAQIREIRSRDLVERSAQLGEELIRSLRSKLNYRRVQVSIRGAGLLVGVELREHQGQPAGATALAVVKSMLNRGFVILPEGEAGNVIAFTPPLVIRRLQLLRATDAFNQAFEGCRS
jgi:acetylornithine/succinyldiaminopimelate/putrescine aminotransferase